MLKVNNLVTKPPLILIMLPFQYNCFLFVDMIGGFLREGFKKTIESVIMIITGGGRARW